MIKSAMQIAEILEKTPAYSTRADILCLWATTIMDELQERMYEDPAQYKSIEEVVPVIQQMIDK
jgi:hypothetical protein